MKFFTRFSPRRTAAHTARILVLLLMGASLPLFAQVTTFVGSGTMGFADGTGAAAQFNEPRKAVIDGAGNLFIIDAFNHRIRQITPGGVVTTFAGNSTAGLVNGTGTAAQFNFPAGIARDATGNLYIADQANHAIRMITPGGVVTTLAGTGVAGFADGAGASAQFNNPTDVALNPAQNILYVADGTNQRVRAITLPGAVVTTLAGNGTFTAVDGIGTAAQLSPYGIAVDANGNLFVADPGNHRIRKITPEGAVTTLAGSTAGFADGQGTGAQFNSPRHLAIAPNGSLYVSDPFNNRIRAVSPSGMVSTLAGNGLGGSTNGAYLSATFGAPVGVCIDAVGDVYIGGNAGYNVRKISQSLPTITSFGPTSQYPLQVVTISGTNFFGVTQVRFGGVNAAWFEVLSHTQIRAVVPTGGVSGNVTVTNNAGTGTLGGFNFVPTPPVSTIAGDGTAGFVDAVGGGARINRPRYGVKVGGDMYFTDMNSHAVRKVNLATGTVTTFAGSGVVGFVNGTGTAAQFSSPAGIASDGTNLYVSENGNHTIRKIVIATGVVTTLAGSGTPGFNDATGTAAQFNIPQGMVVDAAGNVYVADAMNHRIRVITPGGLVSTLAGSATAGSADGTGAAAQFNRPLGLALRGTDTLYVSTEVGHHIRTIKISTQVVTTLAGSGVAGFADGMGTAAQFNVPEGLAYDGVGTLYVADNVNNRIRVITTSNGATSTLTGIAAAGFADGIYTGRQFFNPAGLVFDAGNLYVFDYNNNRIRKISQVPPDVVSFTPTSQYPLQIVTINGTNFFGIMQVQFGGVNAPWFDVVSTTQIRAVVPTGAISGNVTATNNAGTGTLGGFTLTATPQVSTLAGDGVVGSVDAVGGGARLNGPRHAVKIGGDLYFTDVGGHKVKKMNLATGTVTTIAGSGLADFANGTGTAASFNEPTGIATDGTNLYVCDENNHAIRRIVIASGVVSTFVGTGAAGFVDNLANGTGVQFSSPQGLASDGTYLYCADYGNNRIRRITIASGATETFAGSGAMSSVDGIGTAATFNSPVGITIDGAYLYSSDLNGYKIRRIHIASKTVTTIAGSGVAGFADGVGAAAQFNAPSGVVSDGAGMLYIADTYNHRIRALSLATNTVSTLVGNGTQALVDGALAAGRVHTPSGVLWDGTGLIVTDQGNQAIRKISPATPTITSFTPTSAYPMQVVTITGTNFFGVTQVRFGGINAAWFEVLSMTQIRAVVPFGAGGGNVTATNSAGTGTQGGFAVTAVPAVSTLAGDGTAGSLDAVGGAARIYRPLQMCKVGGDLYVAEVFGHVVRKVNIATGTVTTVAGSGVAGFANGTGTAAQFNQPQGIVSDGTNLFVADLNNHRIRQIVIATGVVTTFAGSGTAGFANGIGVAAQFNFPHNLAINGSGTMYLADVMNHRIRTITPGGVVTTLAGSGAAGNADGTGAAAQFNRPLSLALGEPDNLYVSTENGHNIRRIIISTQVVTTLAGSGTAGFADGTGAAAQFNIPDGLAFDGVGTLYVADLNNHRIRSIITANGATTTLTGGAAGFTDGSFAAGQFNGPAGLLADGGNLYVGDYLNHRIRKVVLPNTTTISSFTPTSASPGEIVTINGAFFTGATQVQFGGINAASYTVVSATQITATVPVGAASGSVSVTAPLGTAALAGFTFVPVPITSFTPTSAGPGDVVTINGG